MSYRNPARIVDTQSGQHIRNMQQSLAKSTTGVIDADTARIRAEMAKAAKDQAALRKKLQTQEEEAYSTAHQAAQQTNTSVRYDNMQENLQYNAHLAQKAAASVPLTSEEKTWQQNFNNVGSSIKTVLANVVSIRDQYEKQSNVKIPNEGSIVASDQNNLKMQAIEIWLNGKDGTSHSYFDGATGETTLIARDLDGVEVGRVTSNGKMYELETVPSSSEAVKTNGTNLINRINSEKAASSVYGKNPQTETVTTKTGDGKTTTQYYLTPNEEDVKKALEVSSREAVLSWTPSQIKNWYNATQRNSPTVERDSEGKFIPISEMFTEDEKYDIVDGIPTDTLNPYVKKVVDAFTEKTIKENPGLLESRFFKNKPEIKLEENPKTTGLTSADDIIEALYSKEGNGLFSLMKYNNKEVKNVILPNENENIISIQTAGGNEKYLKDGKSINKLDAEGNTIPKTLTTNFNLDKKEEIKAFVAALVKGKGYRQNAKQQEALTRNLLNKLKERKRLKKESSNKKVEGKGPLNEDFYNQSFLPTAEGDEIFKTKK